MLLYSKFLVERNPVFGDVGLITYSKRLILRKLAFFDKDARVCVLLFLISHAHHSYAPPCFFLKFFNCIVELALYIEGSILLQRFFLEKLATIDCKVLLIVSYN